VAILLDWHEREIEVAKSRRGVLAVVNPFDNLVKTGIMPWPPPELIQKLYQSRQVRAFSGTDLDRAKSTLAFTRTFSPFIAKMQLPGACSVH